MLDCMPSQKEPKTPFGARLIAKRREKGMTQVQLAQAAETTQRAISFYEAGGGNPTADSVARLAKALCATTDELLGLTQANDQATAPTTPDERRLWRRFRQLVTLPEKDRRAVLRMLDTMTKLRYATKGKNSAA